MPADSPANPPIALCLGVFDGVHRGHEAIIGAARRFISGTTGGRVLALTFDPHPTRIVRPTSPQPLLQSLDARISLLRKAGCDGVIVLPFSEDLARHSASAFWSLLKKSILGKLLGIFAGQNWRFGVGRSGDLVQLASLSAADGCVVVGVPPVMHLGRVISSSWIRDLVREAAFGTIPTLLGRGFEISGTVIAGRKLARQWGFPTANFYPDQECLPPNGVYAGWAQWEAGQPVWSLCNLGTRPSLGTEDNRVLLEAHLIDREQDLYGRTLRFVPVHKIRDEQRFTSLEALRHQISLDATEARTFRDRFDKILVSDGSTTP
jgi:riboflavin kinase/FMN adenylyltransferase